MACGSEIQLKQVGEKCNYDILKVGLQPAEATRKESVYINNNKSDRDISPNLLVIIHKH